MRVAATVAGHSWSHRGKRRWPVVPPQAATTTVDPVPPMTAYIAKVYRKGMELELRGGPRWGPCAYQWYTEDWRMFGRSATSSAT